MLHIRLAVDTFATRFVLGHRSKVSLVKLNDERDPHGEAQWKKLAMGYSSHIM
ncbi:hypothetical protein SCH4B_0248 [Ruegeria sp. TrichCH4B]|nr:hypothetical protein SCH4B_0248 [Ruegeria sp. TrichCH4B]